LYIIIIIDSSATAVALFGVMLLTSVRRYGDYCVIDIQKVVWNPWSLFMVLSRRAG